MLGPAGLTGNRRDWRIGDPSRASVRCPDGAAPRLIAFAWPKGASSGSVALSENELTLGFEPGRPWRIAPSRWGDFSLPEALFDVTDRATFGYGLRTAVWSWQPIPLAVQASPVQWLDHRLVTAPIEVQVDELRGGKAGWQGRGEVGVKGARFHLYDRQLPAPDLAVRLRVNPARLDGEIDVAMLEALSNLQVETLKVNAESTVKGDLTLRVELKGHNPDWQSGRPVHLNLNLQENLSMLLRSLRVADDVTERVNGGFRNRHASAWNAAWRGGIKVLLG